MFVLSDYSTESITITTSIGSKNPKDVTYTHIYNCFRYPIVRGSLLIITRRRDRSIRNYLLNVHTLRTLGANETFCFFRRCGFRIHDDRGGTRFVYRPCRANEVDEKGERIKRRKFKSETIRTKKETFAKNRLLRANESFY